MTNANGLYSVLTFILSYFKMPYESNELSLCRLHFVVRIGYLANENSGKACEAVSPSPWTMVEGREN